MTIHLLLMSSQRTPAERKIGQIAEVVDLGAVHKARAMPLPPRVRTIAAELGRAADVFDRLGHRENAADARNLIYLGEEAIEQGDRACLVFLALYSDFARQYVTRAQRFIEAGRAS